MASSEELSEQLKLTQQLTAAVNTMAASMSRLESSYTSQIASVEQLAKAFESIKNLDVGQLNNTKLDGLQKEFKNTEKSVTSLSGRMKDLGNTMSKKFPTAAATGVAALSGFVQGIRNVIALGKGVTGFFSSFIEGAASIAASIIAIPFKMFNALVDTAAAAGGGANELAEALENLRKEMGDLKGPGTKAVLEASQNLQGFSDTGLSAWRVFGTLAERIQLVTKLAVGMGSTFGVLKDEFMKNGGALLAFQKGLGLSEEGMKALGDRSITMGVPLSKTLLDITKQTTALGKAFDIDQKLIGKDMQKAALDVKHFGSVTVKEIGQASVYARKLGVELDKIVGTLDAFETLDSAAENAAKLGQSFGVNIDAFKMMEAQNPAEQLDMLRKSFKDAGVDASSFSRQQTKLLASTLNLDEATAKQVFSLENQGASLDDIKKKSAAAEKKTMTQAEAMGKLADSIERMVKSGGGQEGGFFEQFFKGFLGGIQASKEFREIIWNIKKSLQLVYFEGVRLGKAFVEMFPGVKQFLQGIADFFKPQKFKALVSGVVDIFKDFMKDLQDPNGKASFSKLMDKLKEKFFDFFDGQSASGKKMLDGFKTIVKTIGKVLAEGIKWAADKATEGIRFIIDLLTGKVNLSAVGGAAGGGLGFLMEVLGPIAEALKNAWTVLAPALWELVKTLFDKLKKFLMSPEVIAFIKPAIPYIAAALFGPAMTRALLGAFTASIGKAAIGALGKGAGKIVDMISGKTAEVAKAAEKIPKTEGGGLGETKKIGEGAKGAIEGSKDWGVQDAVKLGAKLVAIAAALAIGGVMMAAAIVGMKMILSSGGINKPEDAYAPLLVLGAMILGVAPIAFASKTLEQANWKSMFKLVPIAAAVGLAGVAMAAAISLMNVVLKAGGVTSVETAAAPMMILGAMILAMVPAVIGMKIVSSAASPSEVLKGGLVVAAAAAIVGVTGLVLGALLSLINPAKLKAAGDFMLNMSLVFLAMVPLILASMVIGALATGPQAIALAAAAIGLGVIGTAVGSMALIAVGIVAILAKLPIDESFQTKIDAFLGIMKAIQALTDSMVKVIGMLMPGLMDFLTMTPVTKKIEMARKFMVDLIGGDSGGGLIGIINTVVGVVEKIQGYGPEFATAANTFAAIMQATADVMKAMTPPPEFFETQTSFINIVAPWTGMMAAGQASKYMGSMVDSLLDLLGDGESSGIIKAVKMLGAVPIPNVEGAKAVAAIISAIGGLMKALTPDPKVIEAMNESAAGVSYAWGLFKAKGTSDTGKQLKDLMAGQADAANSAIDAITKGPIAAVINNASAFSKEKIEGVKVIGDMMNMVVNLINAVGSSMKSTVTEKVDGAKAERIWQTVPDVVTVMRGIGKQMPALMTAMATAISAVPSDKKFTDSLAVAKTLFGMITEIPKLAKGISEASKGAGGTGEINSDVLFKAVATTAVFFWQLANLKGWGTSRPVMIELIENVKVLGNLMSGAGDVGKMAGTLQGFFDSVSKIIGTLSSASKDTTSISTEALFKSVAETAVFLWKLANVAGWGTSRPVMVELIENVKMLAALGDVNSQIGGLKKTFSAIAEIGMEIQKIPVFTLNPTDAAANVAKVATFMQQLTTGSGGMSIIAQASANMQKYANSMKSDGIIPALDAVTKMVKSVNELDSALNDIGKNKVDIKARLASVAQAVGLGGKAQVEIQNKHVQIQVNMTVTMDAGEVERVIFTRAGSFVRQRLDFLAANAEATPQILPGNPYTQGAGAPNPLGKGGSSGK